MEAAVWIFVWTFIAPSFATTPKKNNDNNKSRQLDTTTSDNSNKKTITMSNTKIRVFGVDREIDVPVDKFPKNEAELEEMHLEGQALLPGCQHGWYDSCYTEEVVEDDVDDDRTKATKKKFKLHYRKFLPQQQSPRAVIVYQHGIATHGGKAMVLNGRKLNLSLLVDEFVKKEGYALYAPDMYGHGT